MAKANPKSGETYTFTGEAPLGADAGALLPGAEVEVREFVAADEVGAHDNSEAAAVVEWDAPSLVMTEDGWAQGTARRAMSIGISQFHDLFAKEA
jgi:hypothetical protein